MEKDRLVPILEAFFKPYIPDDGKWYYKNIFYGPFNPTKKILNAKASYADMQNDERVLFLHDPTMLGSGKEGLILTDRSLYYKLTDQNDKIVKGSLSLDEIGAVSIEVRKNKANSSIEEFNYDKLLILGGHNILSLSLSLDECNVTKCMLDTVFANHEEYPEPVWALPGERIIHKLSSDNFGYRKVFITNARIVFIPMEGVGMTVGGLQNLENYFSAIELDSIQTCEIIHKRSLLANTFKAVLHFKDGSSEGFSLMRIDLLIEFVRAIEKARESAVDSLRFGDSVEQILYKTARPGEYAGYELSAHLKNHFHRNPYKLCLTNKRLMFYRVEQVKHTDLDYSALGGHVSYCYTRPVIQWLEIPLAMVAHIKLGKVVQFHTKVPVAFESYSLPTMTIPEIAPGSWPQMMSGNEKEKVFHLELGKDRAAVLEGIIKAAMPDLAI